MKRYIAKRVGFAAISLVLLSVTIFLLVRLTGDPTVLLVEPGASQADMEAIRRAVGAPKLTLFGISYGTELALAYARAYPSRVERMILDSTVDPDDSDVVFATMWTSRSASQSSSAPWKSRFVRSCRMPEA